MSLYSFYRISKPSQDKVPQEHMQSRYKVLRNQTFWATVIAYSLYYVCRMSLSVVKQPIIDSGALTPGQLGLIGSAFLFVYAAGKFTNGFIADYCNIRRFMATGLLVSSFINLIMGVTGLLEGTVGIVSVLLFVIFAAVWGINGWAQSMGSPPGVIQLSRWFPLSKRGTYYSIFSSTPYIGEFLAFIIVGAVVGVMGWQYGFIFAAIAGLAGSAVILFFVSDTPESRGLPSIQELSGEKPQEADAMPTAKLQKMVLSHPGIWIIAASSAFVYITKYAIAGWGVLFLQKVKDFSLENATQHRLQGGQDPSGHPLRSDGFRLARIFPVHRRILYRQYRLCIAFQPVHRHIVLYCRRAYGSGYRASQGDRCGARGGRHIELYRGRTPGHYQRISDRRVRCGSGGD